MLAAFCGRSMVVTPALNAEDFDFTIIAPSSEEGFKIFREVVEYIRRDAATDIQDIVDSDRATTFTCSVASATAAGKTVKIQVCKKVAPFLRKSSAVTAGYDLSVVMVGIMAEAPQQDLRIMASPLWCTSMVVGCAFVFPTDYDALRVIKYIKRGIPVLHTPAHEPILPSPRSPYGALLIVKYSTLEAWETCMGSFASQFMHKATMMSVSEFGRTVYPSRKFWKRIFDHIRFHEDATKSELLYCRWPLETSTWVHFEGSA